VLAPRVSIYLISFSIRSRYVPTFVRLLYILFPVSWPSSLLRERWYQRSTSKLDTFELQLFSATKNRKKQNLFTAK
jgi:hypothetical protein